MTPDGVAVLSDTSKVSKLSLFSRRACSTVTQGIMTVSRCHTLVLLNAKYDVQCHIYVLILGTRIYSDDA